MKAKRLTPLLWLLPLGLLGDPPNILVIVADDLGYGDPSFTAGEGALIRTPNLDRIAGEGVRLDSFYACPVCSPTRVGTLTGRWPITMGMQRSALPPWNERGIEASVLTLPEILAEHGYDRRACIGKWHVGHSRAEYRPMAQGFSHFYGHLNGAIDYFEHTAGGQRDWWRDSVSVDEEGYSTELLTDEAVRYIRESALAGEPFFIYLAYNAPHSPFQAPEEAIAGIGNYNGKKRTYAAMVQIMDEGVGRILDTLCDEQLADNTLVLFYSDNGGVREVSTNAPFRGGKFSVLEGGVRVCAAARWPAGGIAGGRAVGGGPIGYIDVLPTLCAAAGIGPGEYDPDNLVDGRDVLGVLQGRVEPPGRDWYHYLNQSAQWDTRSVMRFPYKLVWTSQYDPQGALLAKRVELFNIARNPDESVDLAQELPGKVSELLESLDNFMERQVNPIGHYADGGEGFVAPGNWELAGN